MLIISSADVNPHGLYSSMRLFSLFWGRLIKKVLILNQYTRWVWYKGLVSRSHQPVRTHILFGMRYQYWFMGPLRTDLYIFSFGVNVGTVFLLNGSTVETLYSTIYYSKYFIELNLDKSTQYVALWTHKRHPIPRPFGRAMECLLWVFQQKLTVL